MAEDPVTFLCSLSSPHPTLTQHAVIHSTSLKGCTCHRRYRQPGGERCRFPFIPLACCASPVPPPRCNELEPKPQTSWDPALGHSLLLLGCSREMPARLTGVTSGCVFRSVAGLGNTTGALGTRMSSEELLWRRAAQVIRSMFIESEKELRFYFFFSTGLAGPDWAATRSRLPQHCCVQITAVPLHHWCKSVAAPVFTLRSCKSEAAHCV